MSSAPKESMCSFCYNCGKEFDVVLYQSHECRIDSFDIPDSVDEPEKSENNNETLTLLTANLESESSQNDKVALDSEPTQENNATTPGTAVEIKDTSSISQRLSHDMTHYTEVDSTTKSIQIPGSTIQPNRSNFEPRPVPIIEVKEEPDNLIVECISENAYEKNNVSTTEHSKSINGSRLFNTDLTLGSDLQDKVKGTTHESDGVNLSNSNSSLHSNTASTSINNSVFRVNCGNSAYSHPGTMQRNGDSSNLPAHVDIDHWEINQNLSEAGSSSLTTIAQNTDGCQKDSSSEVTYCEFCGLLLSNLKDLQTHQLILHELEHFSCLFCDNIFNETNELIAHLRNKHGERDIAKAEVNYVPLGRILNKLYHCNQCGQGFNFIHKLLSHKREQIKLGIHFFDEGLKSIGNYIENIQNKKANISMVNTKRTTNGSKDTKERNKNGPVQSMNTFFHESICTKQIRVGNRKEIHGETSKDSGRKNGGTKTQERSVHKTMKENNQQENGTITDRHLKQNSISSKSKTTNNDKEIYGKHQLVNIEKDKKHGASSSSRRDKTENKKIMDKQNHTVLPAIENTHHMNKNKKENKTKITCEKPKHCESISENNIAKKKTAMKTPIKVSSKNVEDKKPDDKRRDDKRPKSSSCTSQKVSNSDHKKTDDIERIKKKPVEETKHETDTRPKYKGNDIENNSNHKDFKIKSFHVLLKKEKIEKMTSKITSKSDKNAKVKDTTKRIQSHKETKYDRISDNSVRKEGAPKPTTSYGSDYNISRDKEALLREKKIIDKKDENTVQTQENIDQAKFNEPLLKIQAIKRNEMHKTFKDKDNTNIVALYSKGKDKVKKTGDENKIIDKPTQKIKNPPKCRDRIISECDIFSDSRNVVADPKKKIQFMNKKKNVINIKETSLKEPSRDDPNRNDPRGSDHNTQNPSGNNVRPEPSQTEIEQEHKKKLSLQQYKDIRNVSHQSQVTHSSLIVTQISEQAMQIINEVAQEIGIYNTSRESNSDAKFSDDPESDVESSLDNKPTIFCEACGSQCQDSDHLRQHMAFMHPGFYFVCFVCDQHFSTLDAVINHQVKYSKDILMSSENQFLRRRKSAFYPYYCNHCGKGYTLIDLVAIHKKQEHNKQTQKRNKGLKKRVNGKEKSPHLVQDDKQNKEDEDSNTFTIISVLNTPESSRRNSLEINKDQINAVNSDAADNNGLQTINNEEESSINNILNINVEANSSADKHDELSLPNTTEARHKISSDPNFPRFCESCGRKHLSLEDQQMDSHHEKFTCIICNLPFESIDLLVRHYDFRHPKYEVANFEYAQQRSIRKYQYSFYCKFCGKSFHFIGELLSHRESDHLELLQKEKDDNKDPGSKQKDDQKKENNDLIDSASCDVDVNKKSSKNNNEISLSDISDNDSNLNSLTIDLDDISSSEEFEGSRSSNFIDVEEFMKKKRKNTGGKKSDVPHSTRIVTSLGIGDDKTAKQISNELSLTAKEDVLNDTQEEKVCINSPVSIPIDENLLENCHEDVIEISPSQNSLNKKIPQDITPSFCEACGQKFPSKHHVTCHFKNNHKAFICSVCNRRFSLLDKLIKHQTFKYRLPTLEYAEKESFKLLLSREVPAHFRYYCNACGAGFNYIYDLKAHNVLRCLVKAGTCILPVSYYETTIEHRDLSDPLGESLTKNNSETHICLNCGRTFGYKCELTWHTSKGCSGQSDTPQMSVDGSDFTIALNLPKIVARSSIASKENNNSSVDSSAKTFQCPLCPSRTFVSEQALNQHSISSKKHIKRAEQKQQISTESLNLPLTYLITEADSTIKGQPDCSASCVSTYRQESSSSSRARSRSPPRSRRWTELSDLRRQSIEREIERTNERDDGKKKRKKSKKRSRNNSESGEHNVKRPRCAKVAADQKSVKELRKKINRIRRKPNDLEGQKSIPELKKELVRRKKIKRDAAKATEHIRASEKKNENTVDNLEGIYTLKLLEKMCP